MMKKHDEGYVLAYVTVVLALFCLIATMILTGAMKNLNAQQDDIARMKDQYEAAGMIEKVVVQLDKGANYLESYEVKLEDVVIQELIVSGEGSKLTLFARSGDVTISCDLLLEGATVTYNEGTEDVTVKDYTKNKYEYVTYQVGTVSSEEAEDGGVEQ